MKDSKRKSKPSRKPPRHEAYYYGIVIGGRLQGGISSPELFGLNDAKEYVSRFVTKKPKIVKIRVTHEVIAEVIA